MHQYYTQADGVPQYPIADIELVMMASAAIHVSSSKRLKHIKAKYLYIRHHHKTGELTLKYCPTEEMWADILTKPLQGQGSKFRIMRTFLMNCPPHNPQKWI
jgi:hypothetical protein